MSKNVIDQKSIRVKEDLFDEILNGFKRISEKEDKKSIRLSTIQRFRLSKVAESFLNDERTNGFTREWVGRLTGSDFLNDIVTVIQSHTEEQEDDEDEIEDDEEENKKTFSIFDGLKFLRILHTMNTLYNAYKTYEKTKDKFKDFTLTYQQIKASKFPKSVKSFMLLNEIQKLLEGMLLPLVIVGGTSLVKYVENNPAINKIFDTLEQQLDDLKKDIVTSIAIDAALFATGVGSIVVIARWGIKVKDLVTIFRVGRFLYGGAKGLYYYQTVFKDFDNEDAMKFQEWIDNNITIPTLVPQAEKLGQQIDFFVEEIDEKIDIPAMVKDAFGAQTQQFKDDINFGRRVVGYIGGKKSKIGEVPTNTRQYNLRKVYNPDTQQFQFDLHFNDTVNNVFDAMMQAHQIRYNVVLSEQSYKNMYDEEKGLYALKSLKNAQEALQALFSDFYTDFDNFLNSVKDGLIMEIDKRIKSDFQIISDNKGKIKKSEEREGVTTPQGYTREEILADSDMRGGVVSTVQPIISNPPVQPKSNRQTKKLRLSERSLQPIHPIFTNGALTGIELELLDASDKEISIKVSNWLHPNPDKSNATMQWVGNNKKLVTDYLNYHTNLDILRNEYLNILDQEKEIDKSVALILEQIYKGEKIERK